MSVDPTWPPTLLESVRSRSHHRILVTGPDTALGSAVAHAAHTLGAEVVALDDAVPAGLDIDLVPGSWRTGAGLDAALSDVQAVVHCAGLVPPFAVTTRVGRWAQSGFAVTRRLLESMAAWAPRAHLVLPSHLGCWEVALPAYRVQADLELVVQERAALASIVRIGTLHPDARGLAERPVDLLAGRTSGVSIAPTDPAWVAARLVEVALTRRPLETPRELAGPETLTLADVVTLTAHLNGRRPRRVLSLPHGYGGWHQLAERRHLPTPVTELGGRRYDEWWAQEIAPQVSTSR